MFDAERLRDNCHELRGKLTTIVCQYCSIMVFTSFLHYLAPLQPPWQAPCGGYYWVQISLSYLYYLGYLVLGHFFLVEGCFPPVLFTASLGVSLAHLTSGAPFRPLG
jgi:hypothetical protein